MPIDLKALRDRANLTQDDVAGILGVTKSKISRLEADPDQIPSGLFIRWLKALGADLASAPLMGEEPPRVVALGEPYKRMHTLLDLVSEHCSAASKLLPKALPDSDDFLAQMSVMSRRLRRKPNVLISGHFDSGKTRLVNLLTGSKFVSRYSPATRIVTHIRHAGDRPNWEDHSVWLMKETFSLEAWGDQEHWKANCFRTGGLELLTEHGVYAQGNTDENSTLLAFVFLNAPILEACNLIDLPGFRGTQGKTDKDAERATAAFSVLDVLIYMSKAPGFLDGIDMFFLGQLLRHLPVIEAQTELLPFANLFVVASQAHPAIDDEELETDILNFGANEVFKQFETSVIADRKRVIGKEIVYADIRSRFFAFWEETRSRREPLQDALLDLLRTLPKTMLLRIQSELSSFRERALTEARKEVALVERAIADKDRTRKEFVELQKQEEVSRPEREGRRQEIEALIEKLQGLAVLSFETFYNTEIHAEKVGAIIERRFQDDRERAQKHAAGYVMELLQSEISDSNRELAGRLTLPIERYLATFETSPTFKVAEVGSLGIPFDARAAFASGLAIAGTLGGLAAWAATLGNLGGYVIVAKGVSLLSALGITFSGGAAGAMGAVAAIGGPITLAAVAAIIAGIMFWQLFGQKWSTRLANRVISEFERQKIKSSLSEGVREFWSGTLVSFRRASERLESQYAAKLRHFESRVVNNSSKETELARLQEYAQVIGSTPVLRLEADSPTSASQLSTRSEPMPSLEGTGR